MKNLLTTFLLLFLIGNTYSQTSKPFLKLTIKEGKIVESVPLNQQKGIKSFDKATFVTSSVIQAQNADSNNRIHNFIKSGEITDLLVPQSISDQNNSKNMLFFVSPEVNETGRILLQKPQVDENLKLESLEKTAPSIPQKKDQFSDDGKEMITQKINTNESFEDKPKGYYMHFDKSLYKKVVFESNPDQTTPEKPTEVTPGWDALLNENFEGTFPGNWNVFINNGATDAYWGKESNRYVSSSYSCYCAAQGTASIDPSTQNYPSDMISWMVAGPFDLSNATDANFNFQLWNDTELEYDILHYAVSIDGEHYYGNGTSGNTGGWEQRSLDLTDVYTIGNILGESQVWIAFIFDSDGSVNEEGSYIDDVLLEINTGSGSSGPDLYATSMSLSNSDWCEGDEITAGLTIENGGDETAGTHKARLYVSTNSTISDSDTQLGNDLNIPGISPGNSETVNETFDVPALSDGTYYLGAVTDYYDDVDETDETNNIGVRNGTIDVDCSGPDLTWNSFTISSSNWCEGDEITAGLTEENLGNEAAGAHSTRLYISTNSTISDTDTQLGSDIAFPAIGVGENNTQNKIFTVPALSDGTYYLGAMVDFYDDVDETDETNNNYSRSGQVSVACNGVDLHWTSMSLSSSTWCPGDNITAGLTEENSGNVNAGAHYTRIYLSSDNSITNTDTQLGTDLYYSGITAGNTSTVNKSFSAPSVSDGTYYIGALVDYYDDVDETNETNNGGYRSGQVSVACNGPDLEPNSLALSATDWCPGEEITAGQTVDNTGNQAAGAHYTRIYLSSDNSISNSDTQLGDDLYFSGIAAGSSATVNESFTVPSVTDGTYYLGVIVDYYDSVEELNENNNVGVRNGTVEVGCPEGPDLVWTNFSITSSTWCAGDEITAGLTTENSGGQEAGAHYSRLYISPDNSITNADTQLGTDLYFSGIGAGSTQTVNKTFSAPSFSDGIYYLGALVDFYDDVDETDESNNGGYRSGTVTYACSGPDLVPQSLSLSSSEWCSGDQISADLTTENTGDLAAGTHYSRLYLSVDNTISNADTQLGDDLYFSGIGAGSTATVNKIFSVPSVADGTYYLGTIIDYYAHVNELDETNNTGVRNGTVEIGCPEGTDLVWTTLALTSETWCPGDQVTAGLTEENQGGTLAGAHNSRLYISTDNVISNTDTQLGTDLAFSSINSGSTQTVNKTFTVPALSDGSYYVGAIVDYYDTVDETDESNNNAARNGQVNIACNEPDLVPLSMSLSSDHWCQGDEITFDLETANNGNALAGSHYTRIYLSDDTNIDNTDELLSNNIPFQAISPGESQTVNGSFIVPDLTNGLYYIGVIVDYFDDVAEANEANNYGYLPSQISVGCGGPDLTWSSLTLTSSTWCEGDQVTAGLTEDNLGDESAGIHYTKLFLSEDVTVSNADTQLGSDLTFPVIAAGSSNTVDKTFSAPDVSDGTYYVGAIVDYYNDVNETDETNNDGVRSGQVYVSCDLYPDIEVSPTSLTIYEDDEPNSVVGNWTIFYDWNCDGDPSSHLMDFYEDFTFTTSESYSGTWSLDGNTIEWVYTSGTTYTGIVNGESMSGTMVSFDSSQGCFTGSKNSSSSVPIANNKNNNSLDEAGFTKEEREFFFKNQQADSKDYHARGLKIPEEVKNYWMTNTKNIQYYERDLAASVDWSANDTPIRNQRSCGSCWAFAALALIENLAQDDYDLAEQTLVSCVTENSGCDGGWYGYALEYINLYGVPNESCHPYSQTNGNCNDKCQSPDYLVKVQNYDKYGHWGEPTESTVNDLKALLNTGPVLVSFDVPNDGSFDSYSGGIYDYDGPSFPDAGHAVLVVGYNDEEEYFKVKNSWGSSWGENGYFRISYDDVTDDTHFGGYAAVASGINYTEGAGNSFTISNVGTDDLTVTNISDNKSWLSTSGYSLPEIIAPGNGVDVTVEINWDLVTSQETGTITISSDDPDEPQVTVDVTVVPSSGDPNINVEPTLLTIYETEAPQVAANDSVVQAAYISPLNERYIAEKISDDNGNTLIKFIVDGKPPKNYRVVAVVPQSMAGATVLPTVPAFSWSFGCSATAAAMVAGYYDYVGYPDMYTGPTNGGLMPLDNHSWGSIDINGENRALCPLSATMSGLDGRSGRGHVDDYWIEYGSTDPDPYITNGWSEHTYEDCTGDFMKTNQSQYDNTDGSTTFWFYGNGSPYAATEDDDGQNGFKQFIESRGYTVENYYNQLIAGYDGNEAGFTYEQFKQEIDAGRPVLIHVQGHSMVGVGYDEGNIIYLHDTWDYSVHSMTWGGTYGLSEMQHYGISVIQLSDEIEENVVVIQNTGSATLIVNSISDNKNWLTTSGYTTPLHIEPGNSVAIAVQVNWDLLSSQDAGTITISSNDPDEPTVNVDVSAIPDSGEPPVADFDVDDTTPATFQAVHFTDQSENTPTSWSWSFPGGDPATSTAQNPIVTYNEAGYYDVTLTVTNEEGSDTETKEDFIHVTGCNVPEGWSINIAEYEFSGEIVAQVNIDDSPVESGILAAFVGNECRGIAQASYFPPSGQYIFSLMCYSNQASGEELSFKYLDLNSCEICDLAETVTFSSNMIVGNGNNPYQLNCGSCLEIDIPLTQGWNWFSINLDLDDHNINTVLSTINPEEGDYIKNQTLSATYYDDFGWYGTLSQIVPSEMYMIKLANSGTLVIEGCETAHDSPINLNTGWTWIGYLPQLGMDISSALGSLSLDEGDYIKNQLFSSTYYSGFGWYGTLEMLNPYEGYKIKLGGSDIIVYPESTEKSGIISTGVFKNNAVNEILDYAEFENNGSLTAGVFIENSNIITEGDLLLAYTNGQCRGIAKPQYFAPSGEYYFDIMVFSNAINSEELSFKYFSQKESNIYECIETVPFSKDMVLANALNPVKLTINSSVTSISELSGNTSLLVYPNPFKNKLNIEFNIDHSSKIQVGVYNLYGREITILENSWFESGSYQTKWDGKNMASGTYMIKLISDDGSIIKKVILK